MIQHNDTSGLYYKHITIINDDSSVVSVVNISGAIIIIIILNAVMLSVMMPTVPVLARCWVTLIFLKLTKMRAKSPGKVPQSFIDRA
jgi:hypothetical protein